MVTSANNFQQDFDITWGDDRAKILDNGNRLILFLDKTSGSSFQSKHSYLFSEITMQLKLVPGNSAGTVTTFFGRSGKRAMDLNLTLLLPANPLMSGICAYIKVRNSPRACYWKFLIQEARCGPPDERQCSYNSELEERQCSSLHDTYLELL